MNAKRKDELFNEMVAFIELVRRNAPVEFKVIAGEVLQKVANDRSQSRDEHIAQGLGDD